jgi:hypothetical protein
MGGNFPDVHNLSCVLARFRSLFWWSEAPDFVFAGPLMHSTQRSKCRPATEPLFYSMIHPCSVAHQGEAVRHTFQANIASVIE